MGYDVALVVEVGGDAVEVGWHTEGSTYAIGGDDLAVMTVTYNYSGHFARVFPDGGLRFLHGKRAEDVLPALEAAVAALGQEWSDNYWDSTPGNAGAALAVLLGWARQHPAAVFEVV